jgi:hypothetical protein
MTESNNNERRTSGAPRSRRTAAMRVGLAVCAALIASAYAADAFDNDDPVLSGSPTPGQWWAEGDGQRMEQFKLYPNKNGAVGILNTAGPIETKGHPFFEPLGTNGRACVTCHQPSDAMSLSVGTIRERWEATNGKDPLFAAIDGSNCPSLPQDDPKSHSLLLDRGLFRVALPWPPKARDGSTIEPDFELEVVRDPTGCNTDPKWGLAATGQVSVYRRPRPFANLKYVIGAEGDRVGAGIFSPKGNAMPMETDPETGKPVTMQIMSDARHPTLKLQAIGAARDHLQTTLDPKTAERIVDFGMKIYAAQALDHRAGLFTAEGTPEALGPHSLARNKAGVLADNFDDPMFFDFDAWKKPNAGETPEQTAFRQSVARGYDVFFLRPFWINDAMHINTVGLGNPTKRTCATCHNMQNTGMDLVSGWVDLGTTNLPWAKDVVLNQWDGKKPELPLFKITCKEDAPQHIYAGRVIYTQDPGRALISGKCYDVGSIVMQQFRGLSARAPYFSNGSARTLRELVDFYDRRFNIGYSEQERIDLVNFLSVL